jgi:hypothetical protein
MSRSEVASPRFTLDANLLVYSVDLDGGEVEIHNPFDPGGGLTNRARQLLGL